MALVFKKRMGGVTKAGKGLFILKKIEERRKGWDI
jgi:hypothetical protein